MKSSKDEVSTKSAEMIDEIRTRYTIAYYPSARQATGTFCRIKVQVRAEAEKREGNMAVRAKTGYYR